MEMSHHQFCLKWNNHSTNLLKVFGRLFSNESFTDVTLAAEGRSIRAHKVHIESLQYYIFFPPSLLDIKKGEKEKYPLSSRVFLLLSLALSPLELLRRSLHTLPLLAENR